MRRASYDYNLNCRNVEHSALVTRNVLGGGRDRPETLPEHHVISWEGFLPFAAEAPQRARRLDTVIAGAPESAQAVATHHLLRGFRLGLPTGQALARHLGLKPLKDDTLLATLPAVLRGDAPVVLHPGGGRQSRRPGRPASRPGGQPDRGRGPVDLRAPFGRVHPVARQPARLRALLPERPDSARRGGRPALGASRSDHAVSVVRSGAGSRRIDPAFPCAPEPASSQEPGARSQEPGQVHEARGRLPTPSCSASRRKRAKEFTALTECGGHSEKPKQRSVAWCLDLLNRWASTCIFGKRERKNVTAPRGFE